MDEGFMAEVTAKTVQQEREEVYVALQYAASFHCLVEGWRIVKSSTRKQKINGFSWIRKGRTPSIERSGVLRPTGIDV